MSIPVQIRDFPGATQFHAPQANHRIAWDVDGADTYAWYENDVLMDGETSSAVFFNTVIGDPEYRDPSTLHGNIYYCAATNKFGSITSGTTQLFVTHGDPEWGDTIVYARLNDAPGETNLVNLVPGGPTLTAVNSTTEAGVGYNGENGWVGTRAADSYIQISSLPPSASCTIEMIVKATVPLPLGGTLGRDNLWSVNEVSVPGHRWPFVYIYDGLGDTASGYPGDGIGSQVRIPNSNGSIATIHSGMPFDPATAPNYRNLEIWERWVNINVSFQSYRRSIFKLNYTTDYPTSSAIEDGVYMGEQDFASDQGYTIGGDVGGSVPFEGIISELRITAVARTSESGLPPYLTYGETGYGMVLRITPEDVFAKDGISISFNVKEQEETAIGTVLYQWRKDGVDIPGATSDAYNTTALTADDGAKFSVVVSDDTNSIESKFATLTIDIGLPVITEVPTEVFGSAGSSANFVVGATSDTPLTYQWYRDDVLLTGETSYYYGFTIVSGDAGLFYKVDVTNDVGTVTTNPVTVSIGARVLITTHPQGFTVFGSDAFSVTLEVAATGDEPLTYQWYFAATGGDISGQTTAQLLVDNINYAVGDGFYCRVDNNDSFALSDTAVIAEADIPSFPLLVDSLQSTTTTDGSTATIYANVTQYTSPVSYQWYLAGAPIEGENESSLILSPVYGEPSLVVHVIVSDLNESVTTNTATMSAVPSSSSPNLFAWVDFYSHGTEENMFWLTGSDLLRADQQIQLIDNPKEYFVERKHIDLDDLVKAWTTNKWKHLKQFYFHLQSPSDIGTDANTFDITVGWSKNLMDDPEWLVPATINLQSTTNSGEYKYDFRTTGRYLAMKMDFSNTKEIKMTGGDLDASESHGR